VLTRDAAITVLQAVTCAPITRTIRGIRSEVEVSPEQGLPEAGVISCDNLLTIPQAVLDPAPLGRLDGWGVSRSMGRCGTPSTSAIDTGDPPPGDANGS